MLKFSTYNLVVCIPVENIFLRLLFDSLYMMYIQSADHLPLWQYSTLPSLVVLPPTNLTFPVVQLSALLLLTCYQCIILLIISVLMFLLYHNNYILIIYYAYLFCLNWAFWHSLVTQNIFQILRINIPNQFNKEK